MDPATITLITTLISLAIKYAPELMEQGALAISLLNRETELTDEEKLMIMEASTKAHRLLQQKAEEQLELAEQLGIRS